MAEFPQLHDAILAGNMNAAAVLVWMVEVLIQLDGVLEAFLITTHALMLEARGLVKQII